ncbi:helix-turn-helix domain-containing protein [Frankia sp. Cr2]|uniref:helix-turn-helix domain-containing protein n=1 Tax=Frankia sp. Cr2 TaxID=3073932 RepID=UPI002AD3BED9|nr:helix-turn-helix domain-containing protein [Frankia sp. Cr2]
MAGSMVEPLRSQTFLPPDDVGEVRRVVAALDPAARGPVCGSLALSSRDHRAHDVDVTGTADKHPARLVAPDGQAVDLPPAIFAVLGAVARAMLAGRAVTISPTSRRLTTQEAADLLGVSRPTLVKILDEGEIPYERPGRHRRIRLDDVLRYQQERQAGRRTTLRALTRTAQELGLYDTPATDYNDVLQRARHGRD